MHIFLSSLMGRIRMMNKRIYWMVFFITVSFLYETHAQTGMSQKIDEMIVSATRIPSPMRQIGVSIEVITAEDLKKYQTVYLQDALNHAVGVNIYQSGGKATQSSVFIRGLTGKYTSMVIDDIQVNDPVSQQAVWSNLTINAIQKIEILRGSQSVLYGSESIGGVINAYTRLGGDTQQTISIEYGHFDTEMMMASASGESFSDRLAYGISVQNFTTDGISARDENEGHTEKDMSDNLSFSSRFAYRLNDNIELGLSLRHTTGMTEFDQCGFPYSDDCKTDFHHQAGRLSVTYHNDTMTHIFSYSRSIHENENSVNGFLNTASQGVRSNLDYQAIVNLSPMSQLVIGLQHETEEYASGVMMPVNYAIDIDAIYVLWQRQPIEDLNLTFAIRRDEHDSFSHNSYRMTAIWDISSHWAIRSTVSTGYRVPSLFELYSPFYGNEALQPEESLSKDMGLIFTTEDDIRLELSVFEITVENRIRFHPVTYQSVQVKGATQSYGIEFLGRWKISDTLFLSTSYTYLHADKDDGSQDIRRPKQSWNAEISIHPTEKLSSHLSMIIVRDVVDTDFIRYPSEDVSLDNYILMNMSIDYAVMDTLSVYGRIENVLNDEYQTVLGYGTPDRSYFIGLRAEF